MSKRLIIKNTKLQRKKLMKLIFHVVWGLQSLERESKEEYNIQDYLEKWLLKPLNFKVSSVIEEKDWELFTVFTKIFLN